MPFSRPTLTQIRAQTDGDILSSNPNLLRFATLRVVGVSLSYQLNGLYGYQDWISQQAVPFTATGEFLYAWGALKNVNLIDATAASGQATFTGIPGKVIPAGTIFGNASGIEYSTTADVTVPGGGNAVVTATATTTGANTNMANGTPVTFDVGIDGIQSTGAASTAFTGGADLEDDEDYRTRMLDAYQAPPQGGAYNDYIEWALAVPGVTRAWMSPSGMGAGTVVVYTMFDVSEAAYGGFPQGTSGGATAETRITAATGDLLAVANAIFPLRPVTSLVYSVAPVANPVSFTINGISGASTATKAAISAAITSVFAQYGGPGGALDIERNVQGTVDLEYINSAIAALPNTTGFVLTAPTADITSPTGQIPTLGTVTYT